MEKIAVIQQLTFLHRIRPLFSSIYGQPWQQHFLKYPIELTDILMSEVQYLQFSQWEIAAKILIMRSIIKYTMRFYLKMFYHKFEVCKIIMKFKLEIYLIVIIFTSE